jgi:hypothetical protein
MTNDFYHEFIMNKYKFLKFRIILMISSLM